MSSNNNNPEKGVLYSYKLNDLNNLYKFDYSNTGHGNGMTYDSKKGKVLTLGYYGVCEYNEDTLIREKDYNRPNYPGYSAIGYDYNMDLYIGRANHRIFFADTINMKYFRGLQFLMINCFLCLLIITTQKRVFYIRIN